MGEIWKLDSIRSLPGHVRMSGVVCLSFDDGPHPDTTPKLLQSLREAKMTASFFVVGKRAEQFPDLIAAMIDEGHDVLNHSYSHPRLVRLSADQIRLEFVRTEEILQRFRPTPTPYLVRMPYGVGGQSESVQSVLCSSFRRPIEISWSIDTRDFAIEREWDGRTDIKDYCKEWAERVVSKIPESSGQILLLHDSPFNSENKRTSEACMLHTIHLIKALHQQGTTSIGCQRYFTTNAESAYS